MTSADTQNVMALFRRVRKKLAAPAPGFGDFWVTVHVRLATPIVVENDPAQGPALGFYRKVGIRALPGRLEAVLTAATPEGTIEWTDTTWTQVDPNSLEKAIRDRIEPLTGEGVWYKSGRILYSNQDQQPRVQ